MLTIGFGILLGYILYILFGFVLFLAVIAFIANLINGEGFGSNLKSCFKVVGKIVSFGFKKRA